MTTPGTTPAPAANTIPPSLLVLDADNLTVRDRIQLPEYLAGRSVFNSDESVLYAISDSGVMVLPMDQFDRARRVVPTVEDVVFRGNFCNTTALVQEFDVVDPSGQATPFQVCLAGSEGCTIPAGISDYSFRRRDSGSRQNLGRSQGNRQHVGDEGVPVRDFVLRCGEHARSAYSRQIRKLQG